MRWTATILAALIVGGGFCLAGCGTGADLEDLPALPVVATDRYLPVIREQLDTAVARVTKSPGKAEHNGRLGMMLYAYEQYATAAVMFERAALLAPTEFRWPYLQGRASAEIGATEAAETALLRALTLAPDFAPANIKLAEIYLAAGRLEDCRAAIEAVLGSEPSRPEAHFMLGKLALREGDAAAAIEHLQVVARLSGDFGALHYLFAQAYRGLGDAQRAATHLARHEQFRETTADVVDPVLGEVHALDQSVEHLVERAKRFATQGRNDLALELLQRAVANDPGSLPAHVTLVGLYSANGKFEDADRHIAAAQAIDATHPKLYFSIGVARLVEHRLVEAGQAFERSIELDPTNTDAYAQLGFVHEQRQQPAVAAAQYERALAQTPMHRIANWRLSRLRLDAGDAAAALAHLEKIRDFVDPATPEILIDLGRTYAALARHEEAVEALQESLLHAQRFNNVVAGNQARRLLREVREAQASDGS